MGPSSQGWSVKPSHTSVWWWTKRTVGRNTVGETKVVGRVDRSCHMDCRQHGLKASGNSEPCVLFFYRFVDSWASPRTILGRCQKRSWAEIWRPNICTSSIIMHKWQLVGFELLCLSLFIFGPSWCTRALIGWTCYETSESTDHERLFLLAFAYNTCLHVHTCRHRISWITWTMPYFSNSEAGCLPRLTFSLSQFLDMLYLNVE